jgi:hypothetical protein
MNGSVNVSPMFASLKVDASIHCAWLYPIDACGERVTQCSELPIRSHAAHVIGIASGPLKGLPRAWPRPTPGLARTCPGPGPGQSPSAVYRGARDENPTLLPRLWGVPAAKYRVQTVQRAQETRKMGRIPSDNAKRTSHLHTTH